MPQDRRNLLAHAEFHQFALFLSRPISGRLDCLISAAAEAGEHTNRKELLAAIILGSPTDARRLGALIDRHAESRVADAFVDRQPRDLVLAPLRSPGPRQLFISVEQTNPPTFGVNKEYEDATRLLDLQGYRVGISLPEPLLCRLDRLTRLLLEALASPGSRHTIVAALILAAPESPGKLSDLVRDYRMAPAAAAFAGLTARPSPARQQGRRARVKLPSSEDSP